MVSGSCQQCHKIISFYFRMNNNIQTAADAVTQVQLRGSQVVCCFHLAVGVDMGCWFIEQPQGRFFNLAVAI